MSQLAVLGGKPVRTKPWPAWPVHGPEEERNLLGVLRSGKWFHGEKVREFEAAYAAFQDAAYGITCVNGTVAIEIALMAVGLLPGDEVITTPYTFMGTVTAVLRSNGIPIFADIEEETGNLDPGDVEKRITPSTKVILPVHVAGNPVDIDRFEEIGRKHNVTIIYDAAHGWGSQWRGKGVGAYGAFNTYSFQASKNITSAEGGILLTCDENLADLARSWSNCGRSQKRGWYEHFLPGGNLRLTEFQAAILLAQLGRLEAHTAKRAENAAWLSEQFADFDGIRTVPLDPRVTRRAYHMYQLRYDGEAWKGLPREKFIAAVNAEGIRMNRVWPCLYEMSFFERYAKDGPEGWPVSCPFHKGERPDYASLSLPRAEKLSHEAGLWIPHAVLLADRSDMRDIVDAVTKVRENLDQLVSNA